MSAYKIYRSGDNIEIYSYQYMDNPENVMEGVNEGVLERLIEERKQEDRKDERRAQTLRDNANNLKRMAREYFKGNVFFVTLTYKSLMRDIDKSDRKLKYFLKKLKDDYGHISYVGVRELQKKRDVIHYHLLIKNPELSRLTEDIPEPKRQGKFNIKSWKQKEFEQFIHEKYWKHGWVDWTKVDFVDDLGAYLAKYMTKGDLKDMAWLENRRLILRSKDIKKIEPLDWKKDSTLIKEIMENLDVYKSIAQQEIIDNTERKSVFTNGYHSKFAGEVLYYDIHINRLKKDS